MYRGKAVVTKGPRVPNPRVKECFMQEIDTMRTYELDSARRIYTYMCSCTSPYLQPLLAVLDNGSKEPHFVQPQSFVYSPTMIMEYMEAGDLHRYLQFKKYRARLSLELSTIEVALVLAMALADLHRRKVVHRDVKSLNIFLSKTHYVRLGDLGSARTLDVDNAMTSNVGTKYWMAPEVLRVPEHGGEGRMYSSASDIYSFGVVLTELDTLTEPYSDLVDRSNIEFKVRTGQLRPKMSANCPAWLQDLADKCLAFNPKARPAAAEIVKELLQNRNGKKTIETEATISAMTSSDLSLSTIADDNALGSEVLLIYTTNAIGTTERRA